MNIPLKIKILERFGTQCAFSDALELHESYVSQVIHERRKLDRAEMVRWSKALRVRTDEIFKTHQMEA